MNEWGLASTEITQLDCGDDGVKAIAKSRKQSPTTQLTHALSPVLLGRTRQKAARRRSQSRILARSCPFVGLGSKDSALDNRTCTSSAHLPNLIIGSGCVGGPCHQVTSNSRRVVKQHLSTQQRINCAGKDTLRGSITTALPLLLVWRGKDGALRCTMPCSGESTVNVTDTAMA